MVHTVSRAIHYWWEYGNVKNKNKLVELKAFVDSVDIKGAFLEEEFLL